MDWRDRFVIVTVVAFVKGQVGHAAADPLGCKKTYHADLPGIYRVASLTGSHAVVGSGTLVNDGGGRASVVATATSSAAPFVSSGSGSRVTG